MAQNTVEMREREAREEGREAEIDYRREDEVIVVDRWSVATRCTSNMILMVRLSKARSRASPAQSGGNAPYAKGVPAPCNQYVNK